MKYASDFAFFKGYIIERKIKFPSKSQNDTKNSLSNKEKVINNFYWKKVEKIYVYPQNEVDEGL
jgi:hypothetical protein